MPFPADQGARAPRTLTRECLPYKDETPGVQAEGSKVFTERQRPDSASFGTSDQAPDAARFATLQAHFAHVGWILSREPGGCVNVSFWGHVRSFDALDDVARFADRVGAST